VIAATAVVAAGTFLGAMWLFGVVGAATDAFVVANSAMAAMRDLALDDGAREAAVQRASLRLLSGFGSILIRGLMAVAASLVPIWFADAAGFAASGRVFEFLSRWDVIVATSGVMAIGYLARRHLWRSS
jgi:hypothetical protein